MHATDGSAPLRTGTRLSLLPSDADPEKTRGMFASAVVISKEGTAVYTVNRLEGHPLGDALVWFRISEDGSRLSRLGQVRTGLDVPWAASMFHCDGKEYLISGSRTGTGAVIYGVDQNELSLSEVARTEDIRNATCFLGLGKAR